MNRNDSDIYTNGNRKTWLSDMCHELYLANGSHSAVSQMRDSNHYCLSKTRSSLEADKKQLRVWLQYAYSVADVLLHPSFGAPLVLDFIRPFLRSAEQIHLLCARLTEWFLWSPHGDSEMARNGFEDGSKWCATSKICSSANEAGFVAQCTYVYRSMNLCYGKGVVVT